MPNIYYCGANGQGSGMLRAVLSWGDTQGLLKSHPAHYCGRRFPNQTTSYFKTPFWPAQPTDSKRAARGFETSSRNVDFVALRISETEDREYRPGFYCFDANITEVEESLKSLTNTRSPIEVTQPDIKRPVEISQMNQPAGSLRGSPLLTLQHLRQWLNKSWPGRMATRRK